MKQVPDHAKSIRDWLDVGGDGADWFLYGASARVAPRALLTGTCLTEPIGDLAGKSVLLLIDNQFAAALALIELDGVVRRLVVCPPGVSREHLLQVATRADVEAVVADRPRDFDERDVPIWVRCRTHVMPAHRPDVTPCVTEWVIFTSGTTGTPKLLVHDLHSLIGPVAASRPLGAGEKWAAFYDMRRFGGVSALVRSLRGHSSLVVPASGESQGEFVSRLAALGVTHAYGTPSQWRLALMSPAARRLAPRYLRISGEVVDQGLLNILHATYPNARIDQVFGSTESGFGFEVTDGLEGFPASYVGVRGDVEIQVTDGSLRLRSSFQAQRYLGEDERTLKDAAGFVDTGDVVERRGDRYFFLGRKSGLINVGGLKVYPEEIEAVINAHPAVRVSIVRARSSPITGSVVAADVVLKEEVEREGAHGEVVDRRQEILQLCRKRLAAYKVPATLRFVPSLDVALAGKLLRRP